MDGAQAGRTARRSAASGSSGWYAPGRPVAIEFVDGEVVALPTQTAVNLTLSGTDEDTRRADNRYRTATDGLAPGMDWRAAMDLLSEVRQGTRSGRWSTGSRTAQCTRRPANGSTGCTS